MHDNLHDNEIEHFDVGSIIHLFLDSKANLSGIGSQKKNGMQTGVNKF